MSVSKNYYVIAGYDLTMFKSKKYEDWKWTEEGESFTCYQRKGCIQLFDDPMNDDYLYLGYILANGDQFAFETHKVDLNEVSRQEAYVWHKLRQLCDADVVDDDVLKDVKYEIIVFEECI